jgi:AcrR family transcriptional regulator
MKSTQAHSKRLAIIAASCRVVLAEGAQGLTLEATAREAGVSKGGLLYHFPSKEALIGGMIEQFCVGFEAALERELLADPQSGPGRWARAYIRASFSSDAMLGSEAGAALLAAVAAAPELLDGVRVHFARWQAQAEADGLPPALATLLRLAVDGAWFADLLEFAPAKGDLRAQLVEQLVRLTYTEADHE